MNLTLDPCRRSEPLLSMRPARQRELVLATLGRLRPPLAAGPVPSLPLAHVLLLAALAQCSTWASLQGLQGLTRSRWGGSRWPTVFRQLRRRGLVAGDTAGLVCLTPAGEAVVHTAAFRALLCGLAGALR